MGVCEFDKSFPNFGFFKDENFHYFAMLTEQLIKVVMRYNISEFVIDTY